MKIQLRYALELNDDVTDNDSMRLKALVESERRLKNFRPDNWADEECPQKHAWYCVVREGRFNDDDWAGAQAYVNELCDSATHRIAHPDYPAPMRVDVEAAVRSMNEAMHNFGLSVYAARRLHNTPKQ